MTKAQARVLNTIVDYVEEYGYPPTVRELAELTGCSSPGTVHHHLRSLEAQGHIERKPDSPRALRVLA